MDRQLVSLPGSAPAPAKALIAELYADFNGRRIEAVLPRMAPEVAWPNGMEGGYVSGPEAVRAYWTRQWTLIDPQVTPLRVDEDRAGRVMVTVRQVIRDLSATVLKDDVIGHAYTFVDGLIATMEIGPARSA